MKIIRRSFTLITILVLSLSCTEYGSISLFSAMYNSNRTDIIIHNRNISNLTILGYGGSMGNSADCGFKAICKMTSDTTFKGYLVDIDTDLFSYSIKDTTYEVSGILSKNSLKLTKVAIENNCSMNTAFVGKYDRIISPGKVTETVEAIKDIYKAESGDELYTALYQEDWDFVIYNYLVNNSTTSNGGVMVNYHVSATPDNIHKLSFSMIYREFETEFSAYYNADLMYSYEKDSLISAAGFFAGKNYCISPLSEKKCFSIASASEHERNKLTVFARTCIIKNYQEQFDSTFDVALSLFKNGKKDSSSLVTKTFLDSDILYDIAADQSNIPKYNDFGFFLEQGGEYEEAVKVLKEVISIAPSRTVAYLNLGDAYLGASDSTKALKNYTLYISQMKENGKESRIPKRVLEFVK